MTCRRAVTHSGVSWTGVPLDARDVGDLMVALFPAFGEWCGVLYENLYLILLLISPVGKHTVLLLLLGVLV